MKQFLSSDERERLKAQHRLERDKRVCDRIKAVLLSDDGWSLEKIAHALLLSEDAIKQHLHEYLEFQKLKPQNGGSSGKLNQEQSRTLIQHLDKHTYLRTKDIVAYVEATFLICYTSPGMTAWLHAHGFSFKKPAVVPGKANREAQEQWIAAYQELRANLQKDEAICFIDGVHPTHNTKATYGWIRRGERREIRTNTGRQRLNLSGAIDIISKKVLVREDATLNAESTITFFRELETAYPSAKKVHVFCDNAGYYRNKHTQDYLKNSKIVLHFLPPYSPNLNPIERLWKFLYEHVLYNKYYEKFSGFKEAVMGFLQGLSTPSSEMRELLEQRITDNFHIIGTCKETA